MEINSIIYDEITKNHNLITNKQVRELGFSRTTLSNYVNNGLLERIHNGVYILPDSVNDDMYTFMLHSDKIVFSHDSALFLNGLSDRTPFIHSVTIPSNCSMSVSLKSDCNLYYIKPTLYNVGITIKRTTFGNDVKCYNAERTICDLIRSRSRLDEEMFISGIKNYANWKDKDLNLLGKYSKIFKVDKILKQYMEVLL